MADPSVAVFIEEVETDLLKEIIQSLEKNQITEAQASQFAREFLTLLPVNDKKELLDKLRNFSKSHVLAKGVFLKYAAPADEEERQRKLALMSEHIKNGEIEHALNVAKGGTTNV